MDVISALAAERDLLVVEDAAHGLGATYRGRALGSLGDLASISFHETKNVICGEGGALTVNSPAWVRRGDVVYEKGTDRSAFLAGQVDKYTWHDTGSSFGMSELSAAFLWAQLESASEITRERMRIWHAYHEAFGDLEKRGWARRPIVPPHCEHNAHMYYLLLEGRDRRDHFIEQLERRGVQTVFHYVPLHTSPAGRRYGRVVDGLEVTERTSEALVRLPLWVDMEDPEVERVIDSVHEALAQAGNKAPARRGRGRGTGEHSPAESLEQA
jgi:dTDP-4-amino-4,6-dideoxygalactose transaminase